MPALTSSLKREFLGDALDLLRKAQDDLQKTWSSVTKSDERNWWKIVPHLESHAELAQHGIKLAHRALGFAPNDDKALDRSETAARKKLDALSQSLTKLASEASRLNPSEQSFSALQRGYNNSNATHARLEEAYSTATISISAVCEKLVRVFSTTWHDSIYHVPAGQDYEYDVSLSRPSPRADSAWRSDTTIYHGQSSQMSPDWYSDDPAPCRCRREGIDDSFWGGN